MMRAAILSFSERGGALAERIAEGLRGEWQVELRAPRSNLAAVMAELFPAVGALIFVGACGIAVRAVAPLLAGKTRDPAVVVVDERGQHAISLLSGHIGGANALALRVAGIIGGEAVITTATDVNGRFSVDAWAARHGLRISDMALAKRFSAEILRRDLPLWSEFPVEGDLPEGIFLAGWKDCDGEGAQMYGCARAEKPEGSETERAGEVGREEAAEFRPCANPGRHCDSGTAVAEGQSKSPMGACMGDEAERGGEARREDAAESRSEANPARRGAGPRLMEACASQRAAVPAGREMRQAAGARPGEISKTHNGALFPDERARAQGAAISGDIAEQVAEGIPCAEKDSALHTGVNLGHRGDTDAAVVEGQSNPQVRGRLGEEAERAGEVCHEEAAEFRPCANPGRHCDISAAVVEGQSSPRAGMHLNSEAERVGEARWAQVAEACTGAKPGYCGDIGAAVTCRAARPFDDTLRLIPPVLYLGIGCKRGAGAERIAEAVRAALDAANLLPEAIASAASIDVKRDEPGLAEFCAGMGISIEFYGAEELRAQPGIFTASEFVERTVGVDNVCERAAMRAAGPGAKLLVPKRGENGVTVAIARADWRVRFP